MFLAGVYPWGQVPYFWGNPELHKQGGGGACTYAGEQLPGRPTPCPTPFQYSGSAPVYAEGMVCLGENEAGVDKLAPCSELYLNNKQNDLPA